MAFGSVIALLKDVPDIKGDRVFGINTFSVRVGTSFVLRSCYAFLSLITSAAGIGLGISGYLASKYNSMDATRRGVISLLAILAAFNISSKGSLIDPDDPDAVYRFYMSVWKYFYLAYLVFALCQMNERLRSSVHCYNIHL